ncbi:MAG: SDR family NAD(P)-dependent oxidoreductase [Anaerolineae bacterium]
MSQKFLNQVAIVTGASRGIGRATALALAREGANLVLAGRTAPDLEALVREVEALGVSALSVPTDVSVREQVNKLAQAAFDRWGCVDILIANAGIYVRKPVAEMTAEDFERALAVNFYGVLHAILAVLPGMLQRRRGHIVILNSLDGKKGLPPDAPYVASKFALTGLGDVMRQELQGTGVHITSVFPGRVDTPMIGALKVPWISSKLSSESVARAIVRAIVKRQTEVVIPFSGYALIYVNMLAPRLADWAVRRLHLEGWER